MSATPEIRPPAWESLQAEVRSRFDHLAADVARTQSELHQAIEEEKQNEILVAVRALSSKVSVLDTRLTALAERLDGDEGDD